MHLVLIIWKRPYSYIRLTFWIGLSMVILLVYGILSTLEYSFASFGGVQAIAVFCGLTNCFIVLGIFIQWKWIPSLLKSHIPKNQMELFKFAFSFGSVKPPKSALDQSCQRTKSFS
mmetsp:Transcript_29562/g.52811  ORF Transcript_29562/g.52811 Transcript_29562/m.52811 type:complete len:116 (-) Transcript_29562:667-1014(-)